MDRFCCILTRGWTSGREAKVTDANRLQAPSSFRHRPPKVGAAVAEAFAASATVVDLGRAVELHIAAMAAADLAVRTPIFGSNLIIKTPFK